MSVQSAGPGPAMPTVTPSAAARPLPRTLMAGDYMRYAGRGTDAGAGGHRMDYEQHLAWLGPRLECTGAAGRWLHEQVREIGLTGRGGAHFPAAVKWDAALSSGPGGIVVVNAAEGEPAAAKDAALLQVRPHLVLDGAACLAEHIGAREIVVWIHDGAAASLASVTRALDERGPLRVPVRVMLAPDAYVSGEASSVVNAIQPLIVGDALAAAVPRFVRDPARPWGEGPAVLVQNAETLARVGMLARNRLETGASAYVPTSLVTVTQALSATDVRTRTVIEVEPSMTIAEAFDRAGVPRPEALLLGGYGGTWLTWERAANLRLDPAALRAEGLSLGAGVLLGAPSRQAGLELAASVASYLADESARQCGPCVFGLPALAEALGEAARSGKRRHRSRVSSLTDVIAGRGACRHPDGAIRMVMSALEALS